MRSKTETECCDTVVALAGNPNVGKSTLFNALTGMRQHTGNWTGKTVGCAEGICRKGSASFKLVDLPGTYSLCAHSEEERVARDFICEKHPDVIAVVCDATCLERNLILALQILALHPRVVLCVNLLDEAKKKGISVDLPCLARHLGIPVVGMSARSGKGIREAVEVFEHFPKSELTIRPEENAEAMAQLAHSIAADVVTVISKDPMARDRKIDRVVCGRVWAFPLMFLLLALIFWLTMEGANLPSEWLSRVLFWIQDRLMEAMIAINAPWWIRDALILGVYRTVAWVVSVMLPPMAIFFPLFTILEDLGYLPRVAFNLDRGFQKCNACGKQALAM